MIAPTERRATSYTLAGVALAVLLASVLWTPASLPHVPFCTFQRWTSLPCPGCGMTRAFCAISHGLLREAWQLNPFSFLFYAAALLLALRPALGHFLPRMEERLYSVRVLAVAVPLIVAALVLFGVARIAQGPPSI